MKKILLLLLFFPLSAHAQTFFVYDSAKSVTIPDTASYNGALFPGSNTQLSVLYFHRVSALFEIAIPGTPPSFFRDVWGISIPAIATGSHVRSVDSIRDGTISMGLASGDSVQIPSFTIYVGNKSFNLLGDGRFENALQPGTLIDYVKP